MANSSSSMKSKRPRLERNQFGTRFGQTSLRLRSFRPENTETPAGQRKRLFTIHATRVAAARNKKTFSGLSEGHPASSAADPAPELQSLEKTLGRQLVHNI